METNSLLYNRYVNPHGFDDRSTKEQIEDLKKTIGTLQYENRELRELIEAIDMRTKILMKHYNLDMKRIERDYEENTN